MISRTPGQALTIPITPELSVFSLTLGSHEQEFRHRFDVVRDRAGGRWRHPEGGYLGAHLWIQHPQGRRCPAAGRSPSRHLGPHHRENGGQEPRQNPNIGPRTRLIEPPRAASRLSVLRTGSARAAEGPPTPGAAASDANRQTAMASRRPPGRSTCRASARARRRCAVSSGGRAARTVDRVLRSLDQSRLQLPRIPRQGY